MFKFIVFNEFIVVFRRHLRSNRDVWWTIDGDNGGGVWMGFEDWRLNFGLYERRVVLRIWRIFD